MPILPMTEILLAIPWMTTEELDAINWAIARVLTARLASLSPRVGIGEDGMG